MDRIIQFGPLMFKLQWIVFGLSAVVGYLALKSHLKGMKPESKIISDAVFDSILIIILIWKLSLIVFHPVKSIKNPITLVYFSGGVHGIQLALLSAIIYLIYSSRKHKISVWIYLDALAAAFLAGTILYSLISVMLFKQSILYNLGQTLLTALLLFWQMKKFKIIGKAESLNQLLLWFSLGEIFISHFKDNISGYINPIMGFGANELLFYALAVFAVVANFILEKKKK